MLFRSDERGVDGRETEIERREVDREGLRAENEPREVEKDCPETAMECREVVNGRTTVMSCEVERLEVDTDGAVLEVSNECLYAALDFSIGLSGTAEL